MDMKRLIEAISALQRDLDHQSGQLLAAHAAIRGLVQSHPDPAAARQSVAQQLEQVYAAAHSRAVSEDFLAGLAQGGGMQRSGGPAGPAAPG